MGSDVEKRIKQLREDIEHHNFLYYQKAQPKITDQQFDAMLRELIELETEHPELLTPDSPSQRVGGAPIDKFRTVTHSVRMMSIDNTYNEDDLRAFDDRIKRSLGQKYQYVLEPKVDGVACSLRYEDGVLVVAATRGDGARGDDITSNAKTIHSIPLKLKPAKSKSLFDGLPRVLEVRGEVYMTNEQFQKINQQQQEKGLETYANPRNFTAGTLKQLDPKITASRRLQFVVHGLGAIEPALESESYFEILDYLKALGFPTNPETVLAEDVDAAIERIRDFGTNIRARLAYQTDGMVVKIDSLPQRETLGATSKAPRWVIAYKYPAEQAQTVLRAVDWQVGKGGTLTPVARMDPVFVAGTTVSNATLHNIDQIQKLDARILDTVVIEKAGEVIPQVKSVLTDKRPDNAVPIDAPRVCPSCGEPVVRSETEAAIRCTNPSCPAQIRERIKWFVGRDQMNIKGLGDSLIDQLFAIGRLQSIPDLYRLTIDQIAELTSTTQRKGKLVTRKVGVPVASKIVNEIEDSKTRGLARVLAGLGIRHVGVNVARKLALWAGSIENLAKASPQDIRRALAENPASVEREEQKARTVALEFYNAMKCSGALAPAAGSEGGPESVARFIRDLAKQRNIKSVERISQLADEYSTIMDLQRASPEELETAITPSITVPRSVKAFLGSSEGARLVDDLSQLGVRLKEAPAESTRTELSDKHVVITGTFASMGRSEIEEKLRSLGAQVSTSVSSKTAVLVVGQDAGSKLEKARKLGVAQWSEDQLLAFIRKYEQKT